MTIYRKRKKVNYRKIYEMHNRSIPKDEYGRTYEIHHIDGDHNNNEPSNLTAVSIQEHYNIHHSKEEWGACYAIALRMQVASENIEELARKNALKRVANGTHPWCDSEKQSKIQLELIASGRGNFINSAFQSEMAARSSKKQLANGTHAFLDGSKSRERQLNLVKQGKHHWQDKEKASERNKKLVEARTHNFVGENSPTQREWMCPICKKTGKNAGMFTRWHGNNCKLK